MNDAAVLNPVEASSYRDGRSNRLRVTGKLAQALSLIVFEGLKRKDAAEQVGLTEHAVYQALRKPHVAAWFNEQLQAMRTGARARALHRMIELSEQNDNFAAAVAATRPLLATDEQERAGLAGVDHRPGLQIVIQTGPQAQPPIVDITPLPDNE
jgi:hypothetical protein